MFPPGVRVFVASRYVYCCTQTLSQDVKNQESLYLKAKTIQFYFVKIGYVSSRPRSRSR